MSNRVLYHCWTQWRRLLRGTIRLLCAVCAAASVLVSTTHSFVQAQDSQPPQPDPPFTDPDFYGINFINPYSPWLKIGFDSGARVVRWQFNWRDIEPGQGNWDWARTDSEIKAWRQAGLKIHAILHNPPDFALAHPGSGLMPTNLDGPWSSGDSSFARYCNQFASRYKGKIYSYEVWNEPDLIQYWEGSPDEYWRLLKSCYKGIKAADPDVPVAMAGMAYTTNRVFLSQVIRASARDPESPDNNHFFDVMAIHMYGDPELVYDHTIDTRNILSQYGLVDKPIWITETNIALRGVNGVPDTPYAGLASEQEAGWYVLQAASNAIAARASRLMFFRLADDNMDEVWGLVRNDGTARPGYKALQLAASLLNNVTKAEREVRGDVVITDMRRADGARVVTVYAQSGKGATVKIPAMTGSGVLVASDGTYAPITPGDDQYYSITIPPDIERNFGRPWDYSMGGPVVILAEFDRLPPTATIAVVPDPTTRDQVTLKWGGEDALGGTGVVSYDVEISVNGGLWQPLETATTDVEKVVDISSGDVYYFRVRATDGAGNNSDFTEPVQAVARKIGTLVVNVTDLRGQSVPSARVQLSDGSLYDADESGSARIELPPGVTAQVVSVDGGLQGISNQPLEPVSIILDQEADQSVTLLPRDNLIVNGDFATGLQGWSTNSTIDVSRVVDAGTQQPVLRIEGARRPWGTPAAEVTLNVPPEFSEGVLSFYYRFTGGQWLRLRAITPSNQGILWQTDSLAPDLTHVWLDVSGYAGQQVTLRFEIWGPKGGPSSTADITGILYGNVPVLALP